MNSRGTLVRCRIVVETLDSSEAAAITPRNALAAAGTHPKPARVDPARVLRIVTVIGRQDIR